MNNPAPLMQMLVGFNEGWIESGAPESALKGQVTLEHAIASIVARGV